MVAASMAQLSLYILLAQTILLIITFVPITKCKIVEGELKTDQNWAFLTRFCFLSEKGWFKYDIEYPKEYETQSILLYYDEKNQWPAVYKKNKTCHEKEALLSVENGQVIYLNKSTYGSGCFEQPISDEENWLRCKHQRGFRSARERWWYIAVSNCNSKKGLYLKYNIVMINADDNLWFKHFSADEMYILQTDIGFLFLYIILLLASFVEAHSLRARHLLHKTYLLYIASVIYECAGLAFLCANYALYAYEGKVSPAIKLIGKGMESISTLTLLLLLILIAKGYTVTRGRLRRPTIFKISGFMLLYVILYAALFLFEQKFFDPGRVLYLYESPAGFGLIGLRIVSWSWFVYAVIFTLIHYPEKANFYTRFFLLYTLWFLSSPVIVLISAFIVPKWMREKLINGVELFISIKAHIIFFILTYPSKANKNFPFHVRTTQIDIMRENKGPSATDNSLDNFAHHPYAVTTVNHSVSPDYTGLFGVSNGNTNYSLEMVGNIRGGQIWLPLGKHDLKLEQAQKKFKEKIVSNKNMIEY